LILNGAEHRIKSSALATLAKHRDGRRKSRRNKILTAIAITWIFGSFGYWIGGKLPFAVAQSESKTTLPSAAATQPRLLRINLSLSSPSDLKVVQGQRLVAGQVISDRDEERKRLTSQLESYRNTIKRLELDVPKPLEPLTINRSRELPAQSFAEFEAETDLQRVKVEAAKEKVTLQQRKLDLMATIDPKDLPAGADAHEQQKLAQAKSDLAKEEAVMQLKLGQFETAKANRSLKEYDAEQEKVRAAIAANQTQLEYQKALADWNRGEQDRQFRIADLRSKIGEVENKLQEISTVRAQYASEVKRIRYVKQVNNNIDVELLLYVADGSDRPKVTQSQRSTVEQPFNQESFTKPSAKP
jgi:hypothetical protein